MKTLILPSLLAILITACGPEHQPLTDQQTAQLKEIYTTASDAMRARPDYQDAGSPAIPPFDPANGELIDGQLTYTSKNVVVATNDDASSLFVDFSLGDYWHVVPFVRDGNEWRLKDTD